MATKNSIRFKQMVRVVSKGKFISPELNVYPVEVVDAEVGEWIEKGWELKYVDCLDHSASPDADHKNVGFEMLYVLVLPV